MIRASEVTGVENVIDRIAEHVAAELTSHAPTISSTIGADPFFPVLVRGGDGIDLMVLTDSADIEQFYAARVRTFEIVDTTRVTEVRSDWYALHETVATVRHTGDYNGIAPTGTAHRVHSVVLFPTGDDGIVGELEWTRFDFADIFRDAAALPPGRAGRDSYLPLRRLHAAAAHERLLRAWWAGSAAGVSAEVTSDCRWASRHVHQQLNVPPMCVATGMLDVARVVEQFAGLEVLAAVRLQCCANDWYAFAEWKLTVAAPDGRREVRVVSLVPVAADGALLAHLAYSVDAG